MNVSLIRTKNKIIECSTYITEHSLEKHKKIVFFKLMIITWKKLIIFASVSFVKYKSEIYWEGMNEQQHKKQLKKLYSSKN